MWYGNLRLFDKIRLLDSLVKESSKMTGVYQVQLSDIYNKYTLRKSEAVLTAQITLYPDLLPFGYILVFGCYIIQIGCVAMRLFPRKRV